MKSTGYPANRKRAMGQGVPGASRGYKSTTELLTGKPKNKKPKYKKRNVPSYKIPKTPKVSGIGWGGTD